MGTKPDIRQATLPDLLNVQKVMQEAAQWLIDKSEALWSLEQFSEKHLSDLIYKNSLYLAQKENEVVGAFILQTDDELFWSDSNVTKAFYVHKLCVSRNVAGQGVAQNILEWVKTKALRENKVVVRLDCAPRAKLCAFYETVGFKKHSEGRVGNFDVVRYELAVAS
jgi:GNAT superfamily N-acetyltransferase